MCIWLDEVRVELQVLVRVCCLRAFGYFISQLHTVMFTFDDAAATFCGPQPATSSASNQQAEQKMVRFNQHCCQLRYMKFLKLNSKVTASSTLQPASVLREPTCHSAEVLFSPLLQPRLAGARFSNPDGCRAKLTCLLVTYIVCRPSDGHPAQH